MKALYYKKALGSVALSGMLSLTFASAALAASEFTGTLSNYVGPSSTSNGSLSGTVGSGSSGSISEAATDGSDGAGGGGSPSGSRRRPVVTTTFAANSVNPGDDVLIILDDGSAAPASSGTFASPAGTGGGFDPGLEATLAELDAESEGQISPEDAVAFNTEDNPLLNNEFTAAAGDSGISTGRTVAAIVLGLALLGLAGYAVNSLLAYRRENDL